MSKFLFLSAAGDGLGLALRLKQNGHNVAVWIRERRSKQNYDGLLRKVIKWEDFLDKETIVVFDSTGGGKTADRLRAKGHYVFAGSTFADQLELDRGTAFGLLEEVGVKVPHTKTFFDWEGGRQYAKQRDTKLVFKPSGDLAHDPKIGSYVASDAEDLVEMLHYFESVSKRAPEFELQDFVKDGVDISTEGWFNGKEFMFPFNHTVERKPLWTGNLGPSAGCAGAAVWAATRMNSIIENGIGRMASVLRRAEYIGPIDLNSVVTGDGTVWALEFTPRFGYDALPAFLELYSGDIGECIAKLARREEPKEMVLDGGFGAALHLSVPPYPSEEFEHPGGIPFRGLERGDRPHLFFYDIKLDEHNNVVTAPAYGCGMAITGKGDSIYGAFCEPYKTAKRARIPEKQYRTDMAETLTADYDHWCEVVSYTNSNLHAKGEGA